MYGLVAVKYRDPTLRKRLLDTRESELKEWVKSREGYWSALTYSGQAGQNMLGHILMRVREFIRLHKTPPTAKRWPDVTRDDHKTGEQSTARYQTSRHPAHNSSITCATKGGDKKARHSQWEAYINPSQSERGTQPLSDHTAHV